MQASARVFSARLGELRVGAVDLEPLAPLAREGGPSGRPAAFDLPRKWRGDAVLMKLPQR